MQINYTVESHEYIKSSKGLGLIVFNLIDEDGAKRIVSTKAKIGFSSKLKAIQAFHHRETPLVEKISDSFKNKDISVNYIEFNKKHVRDGSLRTKALKCKWEKVSTDTTFIV